MKFSAKNIMIEDYREEESPLDDSGLYETTGTATVDYEVILEAREWGLKSISVIILKISGELTHEHMDTYEETHEQIEITDVETEYEAVEDGEALMITGIRLEDGKTIVTIQRSL